MMRTLVVSLSIVLLAACGGADSGRTTTAGTAESAATDEYQRGPHRGRLLGDGGFGLEVTIFETNVPPHFRLYAYQDGKPLAPAEVQATIQLTRVDGQVDTFTFLPENDYLIGSGEVVEPHSFDVEVTARRGGATHRWRYASYEGRTTIAAAVAEASGVETAVAGPAVVRNTLRLMGTVALDANRHAQIKARFPGIVRAVPAQVGQRVRRGQTLVVVEGNDSMRSYPVAAPFDGVVLARNTSVGDVAGSTALIEIADLSLVWVELRAIGPDAEQLAVGQPVEIASATGGVSTTGQIEALLPLASGQSVVARTSVDNSAGRWRPGMMVSAEVEITAREVALAVAESGLQRFRDFTVVFAQFGDTYEVRMLELGERDGRFAEVLGGINAGTRYVSRQSFLIKADIEKSGASHDH